MNHKTESHPFTELLRKNIPILKSLGVQIVALSAEEAVLEAPFAPNTNHHGTAFGGSIYMLAVASCWALAEQTMSAFGHAHRSDRAGEGGKDNVQIVVQNAEIDYLAPIKTDFQSRARWETNDETSDFLKPFFANLARKGRARASLRAVVTESGSDKICAILTARFVAAIR